MKQTLTNLVSAFVICTVACAMAFAQAGTAQISGRVTDGTGAVLPGVEVTLTQTGTGVARSAVTNEVGAYIFPSLPVGPYRLEAALPGFRTYLQSNIVLQVDASPVIDVVMQVGQVAETVEVQANVEIQVETRNMGIGSVVETARILELPLAGRDVTSLVTLEGAAVRIGQSPAYGMATGIQISVAGTQDTGISYTLDGATHSNPYDGTNMPAPFPDALQEFRISTGPQNATVNRSAGASVNQVTKSGTNEFHGNLFWFVRNGVFNAQDADAVQKDQLKRNQFGGTIGGPVIKNKLFFFTGYQGTETRQSPSSTLSVVPTPALLRGDWSEFNRCYRPTWRDRDFLDDFVDPSRYSNAAKLLSARLPAPTGPCGEVRWGTRVRSSAHQAVTRIDYQLGAKHSIYGRYIATFQRKPISNDKKNVLTVTPESSGSDDLAQGVSVGHTYIINPNTINSLRFAYNRVAVFHEAPQFFGNRDVGIDAWSYPEKVITTFTATYFTFGANTNNNVDFFLNQPQISNDVSLTRGTHQIGFGGNYWFSVIDAVHTARVAGFTINGRVTGDPMGDFLLGELFEIRAAMPNPLTTAQHNVGLYAADTWRVTPRLTVNYGLRWEPYFPAYARIARLELRRFGGKEREGGRRMYSWSTERFLAGQKSVVFPTAPAGFTYPSQVKGGPADPDFIGYSGQETRWWDFSPKVGLAWDPTGRGRTSIRAGFGIAQGVRNQSNHNHAISAPWGTQTTHRGTLLDTPWYNFPGGNPFPFDFRKEPRFTEGAEFVPYADKNKGLYVSSWNLSVQQELFGHWLLSASYIGNSSIHRWILSSANPAIWLTRASHPQLFTGPDTCVLEGRSFTPCNQLGNLNERRQLRLLAAQSKPELLVDARKFSFIDLQTTDGVSNYHGMLLTLRGNAAGVRLNANYTWSHCIGDTATGFNRGATPQIGRDYSNCSQDRRHLFNLSTVATTPRFATPALRAIASDWMVSVIFRAASGELMNILSGEDRALTGVSNQRMNQMLGDVYQDKSGRLGSQLLNRAAFAVPALGSYGNMMPFVTAGFGTWDLDMAASREFRIGEEHVFEIRGEAFNLTNSVRPVNPITDFRSGQFGRVTDVRDARVMQFALKYTF